MSGISVFTSPAKAYGSFPIYQVAAGQNNDPDEYWLYLRFLDVGFNYVIGPNDALEFGIHCHAPLGMGLWVTGIEPDGVSPTRDNPSCTNPATAKMLFGIDLVLTNGIRTSQFNLVDQNGIGVAYGNKWSRASNGMYKVKADLSLFAGMTIDYASLVNENDFGGDTTPNPDIIYTRYVVDYENILIRNRATGRIQTYLYQSGDPEAAVREFYFASSGYPPYEVLFTLEAGVPFPVSFFDPVAAPLLITGGFQMASAIRTTNYTVTYFDGFVDGNGNGITFTLPTAVGHAGQIFYFRNIHATGNLTLDGDAAETIDGAATLVLTPTQFVSIRSDDVNWRSF